MKFIKKPVIIDTIQLTKTNVGEIQDFVGTRCRIYAENRIPNDLDFDAIIVENVEIRMLTKLGDYIYKDERGKFYTCDKEIFERLYDKI